MHHGDHLAGEETYYYCILPLDISSVLPGLQGDVTVEKPVVLCTSRVWGTGGSLWCGRAVGGCRTDVTARRVVTPAQRAHRGAMMLTGGVRVGEGEWRRSQARMILVRAF